MPPSVDDHAGERAVTVTHSRVSPPADTAHNELSRVAKTPPSIAVRPHHVTDRGLGLLPSLGSELRGRHTNQHVPRGLEIVEIKFLNFGLHIRFDTRIRQLREEHARIRHRPWPDTRNGRRRRKTAGRLLEPDDIAGSRTRPQGRNESSAGLEHA